MAKQGKGAQGAEAAAQNDVDKRTANAQNNTAKIQAVGAPKLKGARKGGGGKSKFTAPSVRFAEGRYADMTNKGSFGLIDILNGKIGLNLGTHKTAEAAVAANVSPFGITNTTLGITYAQNVQIETHNEKPENAENQIAYSSQYVPATDTTDAEQKYHCILMAKDEATAKKAIENYNNFMALPYNKEKTIGEVYNLGTIETLEEITPTAPAHEAHFAEAAKA